MLSPLNPNPLPTPADQGPDAVRDIGIENFMADVVEGSRTNIVIVIFLSQRSAACKQLLPVIEKLVRAYKGSIILARVDIDSSPQVAQQMGVQSVPAVYAFFQGRPLDGFMGALPEAQIKGWIERLVKTSGGTPPAPDAIDEAMKHAAEALAAGDAQTAQAIYSDVIDMDPMHTGATAGLLRSLIALGDMNAARAIYAQLPLEFAKDKMFDPIRTAMELADQAGQGGDTAGLLAKVEQNPADHQTRYDLAMAYYAAGQREEAVDQLLEIVKRARTWNEDAARKQLVKFFEAFGAMDPLTISARKRLSSILFA